MNKCTMTILCTLCMFEVSYCNNNINKVDTHNKKELKQQSTNNSTPQSSTSQKSSTTNQKGHNVLKMDETLKLDEYTQKDGISYKITKHGEKGKKAYPGEKVTVHYTGYLLEDGKVGKKFDSSKDRGQHFEFILGQGQVIKGWDLSLADMEIGEERIIVLPPELAYGQYGAGGIIKPNATLVFEVELFKAS